MRGPTGYGLWRQLVAMGVPCIVVAPSLTPVRPGDKVKTDRRDAVRLAQLLRAGELTPVWVPSEDDEALRDLVRAREDAKQDLLQARHRLSKFLLRHGLHAPAGVRNWTAKHRLWLDHLKFECSAARVAFREYLHTIDELTAGSNGLRPRFMPRLPKANIHQSYRHFRLSVVWPR